MAYNFNFTDTGYIPNNYDFDFNPLPQPEVITTYNVLAGASNNFTAIWADADASLSTGRLYIASRAAFSIVNDTVLVDYYTTEHKGAAGEALEQNDIKDINI
jgi:hypothetical protein